MITTRINFRPTPLRNAALAILLAVVIGLSAEPAYAQSRMISVTENLRKQSNDNLTFIEMRNPKTRKVYKRTMVYNGSSASQLKQIKDAISAERDNCSQYSVMGGKVYVLKFRTKDGVFQYILEVDSDTSWTLTATESYGANYDDEAFQRIDMDESPLWLEACARIAVYDDQIEQQQMAIESSMQAVMSNFGMSYDSESLADGTPDGANYRITRISSSDADICRSQQRRIQNEQRRIQREQRRIQNEQLRVQREQQRRQIEQQREQQRRQIEQQRRQIEQQREQQRRQIEQQQEQQRRQIEQQRRQIEQQQEQQRRQIEQQRRQNNSRIRHI